jgi:anionic cell wall polymer biosynthesis LytR-Cps2A-Psr (LCP) family protein
MRGFTDALGGVTVHNRVAFENDGYAFRRGIVKLDGKRALAYIRSGHGAVGDAGRARAQAAYARAVLEDVLQAKILLNPAALLTVVSVVSPYLTVDDGFDSAYVANLGLSLRGVRSRDVRTFALPAPTVRQVGLEHVLLLDRPVLARVRQDLADDSLDKYVP